MANNIRKRYSSSKKTSTNSSVEKVAKKLPRTVKLAMVFLFIIGVIASYLVCGFVCKNDCFEINGKKSTVISVGDTYVDSGAKVIVFGQDATQKLEISVYENSTLIGSLEDIDTSRATTYQIMYTVSSIRYKDVKLIRTLTIVSPEEVAPEEDAYDGEEGTQSTNFIVEVDLKF